MVKVWGGLERFFIFWNRLLSKFPSVPSWTGETAFLSRIFDSGWWQFSICGENAREHLAILACYTFSKNFRFSPSGDRFSKICLCSKLGRGWPFLTVLTTSGVWSRLFKAFTSEYCSSYPSKRCFVPAHFCLQIGFDETNSFPDRHAFSPAREARPSPSSRSYQGWLWGR